LRKMMERMHMGPINNHRDNLAYNDDGIRIKPIPHQQPAPINRPLAYEDLSDNEDFNEGVFGRDVGVDQRDGLCRGADSGGAGFRGYERGDAGHMGNVYEGAGYQNAYGEQPRRQDHGMEESHKYRMKIDLSSFNEYLHIKDFLDWVMEIERFFDYTSIREDRKVKLVAYKFKGIASA